MYRSSAAASRQLIGIAIAPRWLAAKIVARNSMLLYESNADDVAGADTARLQPAGQRCGPLRHLLIGDDVVAEDGERLARRAACMVLEHSEPAHVRIHGTPYGAA